MLVSELCVCVCVYFTSNSNSVTRSSMVKFWNSPAEKEAKLLSKKERSIDLPRMLRV